LWLPLLLCHVDLAGGRELHILIFGATIATSFHIIMVVVVVVVGFVGLGGVDVGLVEEEEEEEEDG